MNISVLGSVLIFYCHYYSLPFFKIIVPTVDTIRYEFVISLLLRAGYRPLLAGPVGTGKTSTASTAIEAMDSHKMSMLVINMSAQVRVFFSLTPYTNMKNIYKK